MSVKNLLVSVDTSNDNNLKDVQIAYKSSDFDPIEDLDLFAADDGVIDGSSPSRPEVNFQVIINPEKLIPPNVKRYANPNTLFADKDTEFLNNEENVAKRNARAKRFGTENETALSAEEITNLDDDTVKKLFAFFSINPENIKDKEKYRLNAIYLRGVQDMSTDDIFFYLRKFSPNFIEWINDNCCNVVWNEKTNAIRAMLRFSKPMKKVNLQKRQKFPDDENNVSPLKRSTATGDISESDEDVSMKNDVEEKEQIEVDTDEMVEIVDTSQYTIPPGIWRVGEKCDKSDLILFRFATVDDVKLRNAEKESIFYKKYGNPNYGGTVGLISRSRKRKLRGGNGDDRQQFYTPKRAAVDPDFVDDEDEQAFVGDLRGKLKKNFRWEQIRNSSRRSSDEDYSPYSDEDGDDMRSKSKTLRMQMRADDVEKKQKSRRTQLRSIKKRIGINAPVAAAAVAISDDEIEDGEILFDDDEDEFEFNRNKPQITTDLRERLKKYRMKITVDNTSGDDDKKLSDADDD